jgi:hypothetical protein
MSIFDGAHEDWTETERQDHRAGSVIAAVLAVMALVACVWATI